MKFRIRPLHLFLGLLLLMLLSNLGFGVKEFFENNSDTDKQGIPGSEIPSGKEDMYILKSEIVPPVCPRCPDIQACTKNHKCRPCPPCGRCPEPSFTCKKVPNYNAANSDYLPRPVLNDFSQFGM